MVIVILEKQIAEAEASHIVSQEALAAYGVILVKECNMKLFLAFLDHAKVVVKSFWECTLHVNWLSQ